MDHPTNLGRSSLRVPRLGVGAMTWGEPRGLARFHPAQAGLRGRRRVRGGETRPRGESGCECRLVRYRCVLQRGSLGTTRGRAGAGQRRSDRQQVPVRDPVSGRRFPEPAGGEPEQAGTLQHRPLPAPFPGTGGDTGLDEPHGGRRRSGEGDGGRSQQLLSRTKCAKPTPPSPPAAYPLPPIRSSTRFCTDNLRPTASSMPVVSSVSLSSPIPPSPGEC